MNLTGDMIQFIIIYTEAKNEILARRTRNNAQREAPRASEREKIRYNILCFRVKTHYMGNPVASTLEYFSKEVQHEKNISAQEETEKKGARLQKENGNR